MQNWKFVRLFKTAVTRSPGEIDALAEIMRGYESGVNGIPAGYTYFGQFVAHDLSELQLGPPQAERLRVSELRQARRPVLDLDSVYGGGLDDSIVRFDRKSGRFELGETATGKRHDLPRRPDGTPLIADGRNDENLLVAQMHVLFMHFHNKLVDHYRTLPGGCRQPATELFARARREAILTYRWITLHDFARRLLPDAVYQHVVRHGRGAILDRCKRWPVTSVEFVGAALRFGHSMIQESYKISSKGQAPVKLEQLFELTGKGQLGEDRLPDDMIVDWGLFFVFLGYPGWGPTRSDRPVNQALQINTSITESMRDLVRSSAQFSIIGRNLERGEELKLASGQEICKQLQLRHPQTARDVGLREMERSRLLDDLASHPGLRDNTPLWAYVLSEAKQYVLDHDLADSKLGVLGGWLVADGLMAAAHYSDVQPDPSWRPRTSVVNRVLGGWRKDAALVDDLTLEDLIVFTYT